MKFRRLGAGVFLFFMLLSIGTLLVQAMSLGQSSAAPLPPGGGGYAISSSMIDANHILVTATGTYQGADLSTASGVYYDGAVSPTTYKGQAKNPTFHYIQGGPRYNGVKNHNCQSSLDITNGKYNDNGAIPYVDPLSVHYQMHIDPAGTTQTGGCIDFDYTDTTLSNSLLAFTTSPIVIGDATYNSDGLGQQTYGANVGLDDHNNAIPAGTQTQHRADVLFYLDGKSTINTTQGDQDYDDQQIQGTFTSKAVANLPSGVTDYFLSGGQQSGEILNTNCPDFIAVSTSDPTTTDASVERVAYYKQVPIAGGHCSNKQSDPTSGASDWYVLMLLQKPQSAGGGATTPNNPNASDCNGAVSSWVMSWIACPFVTATSHLFNLVQSTVTKWLVTDVPNTFDFKGTNTNADAYHKAWVSFRTLAISIVVIAGLVMVISEAFGLEAVSAYTIRRVLPRLIIYAILIEISWPLMRFVAQTSNNLSAWISDIFTLPFQPLIQHANGTAPGTVGQVLLNWGAVLAGLTALGPMGVIGLLFTLGVSVLVLYITLLVRYAILIATIIFMPVALAGMILPGTRRYARLILDEYFVVQFLVPFLFAIGLVVGQIANVVISNLGS